MTIEEMTKIFDESVMLLGIKSEGLQIISQVDLDLPRVIVDKIQIQQVLINLMRNAVEAMEASRQRLLELSAIADGMVRVSVKDIGPGLLKDVADRLFQPFISTKESGMGVGLSICRTIVDGNGGRIWAEPNPAGGTVFSFSLPKAPDG
jgi:two-component system sensor kinase FixL